MDGPIDVNECEVKVSLSSENETLCNCDVEGRTMEPDCSDTGLLPVEAELEAGRLEDRALLGDGSTRLEVGVDVKVVALKVVITKARLERANVVDNGIEVDAICTLGYS